MFPRHNGVATISESFALNLYISAPLTNNSYLLHYNASSNKSLILCSVKLLEHIFSGDSECCNP